MLNKILEMLFPPRLPRLTPSELSGKENLYTDTNFLLLAKLLVRVSREECAVEEGHNFRFDAISRAEYLGWGNDQGWRLELKVRELL